MKLRRTFSCIVMMFMFSSVFVVFHVTAPSPSVPPLILEHSQEWVVDAMDGMEVWSVFAADIDDDGVVEMMTVAEANESGELRIWGIDGSMLTLEHAELWSSIGGHTRVWSVFALDVDNDGVTEILTGAEAWNGQNGVYYNGQLNIWTWDGSTLTLEHGEEWHTGNNTHVYSVFAKDVDNDGEIEIITGGDAFDLENHYIAELRVWNWNGSDLTLETSQGWRIGNHAATHSVFSDDIDNDGATEIITCGNDGTDAQLRVWNWNGTSLSLEHSEEWTFVWLARALSVITADIDDDGTVEIVTGGEANDLYGSSWVSSGQLRVWNWNGSALTLEDSVEWPLNGNSTYVWSVFSADVDDDEIVEVLTGGSGDNGTHWVGQLNVWNFNGSTLVLETNREWITGEFAEVSSVYATDVNNDGVVEIVTSGDAGVEDSVGGQLRVWAFDTGPPDIADVTQFPESEILPEDEVGVKATVIDHVSGVKRVSLNYTNGNGTWIIVNMTNLEGNMWNGTIPAFDYCTYVNYTIVAEDEAGYVITSEEAFGYEHQYHVIPEFPSLIILPLFMMVTMLAAILYKRKRFTPF